MHAVAPQPKRAADSTRLRGFIKNVQITRGYCFVRTDGGTEYFLHVRNMKGGDSQMINGATVEFTPLPQMPGERCARAIDAISVAKPQPQH